MDRTKDNIKKYYESKELSDEKVELLLSGRSNSRLNSKYLKLAVAVLLVIGFVFTIVQFQSDEIEKRIVDEIAMNHKKELKVEFETANLIELQTELDKLDFNLSKAGPFIAANYELIGGRYCSIQGNLAAQLKIRNKHTNSFETLYVTDLSPELQKVDDTDVNSEGVSIKIWKEDGLLYGTASNSQ